MKDGKDALLSDSDRGDTSDICDGPTFASSRSTRSQRGGEVHEVHASLAQVQRRLSHRAAQKRGRLMLLQRPAKLRSDGDENQGEDGDDTDATNKGSASDSDAGLLTGVKKVNKSADSSTQDPLKAKTKLFTARELPCEELPQLGTGVRLYFKHLWATMIMFTILTIPAFLMIIHNIIGDYACENNSNAASNGVYFRMSLGNARSDYLHCSNRLNSTDYLVNDGYYWFSFGGSPGTRHAVYALCNFVILAIYFIYSFCLPIKLNNQRDTASAYSVELRNLPSSFDPVLFCREISRRHGPIMSALFVLPERRTIEVVRSKWRRDFDCYRLPPYANPFNSRVSQPRGDRVKVTTIETSNPDGSGSTTVISKVGQDKRTQVTTRPSPVGTPALTPGTFVEATRVTTTTQTSSSAYRLGKFKLGPSNAMPKAIITNEPNDHQNKMATRLQMLRSIYANTINMQYHPSPNVSAGVSVVVAPSPSSSPSTSYQMLSDGPSSSSSSSSSPFSSTRPTPSPYHLHVISHSGFLRPREAMERDFGGGGVIDSSIVTKTTVEVEFTHVDPSGSAADAFVAAHAQRTDKAKQCCCHCGPCGSFCRKLTTMGRVALCGHDLDYSNNDDEDSRDDCCACCLGPQERSLASRRTWFGPLTDDEITELKKNYLIERELKRRQGSQVRTKVKDSTAYARESALELKKSRHEVDENDEFNSNQADRWRRKGDEGEEKKGVEGGVGWSRRSSTTSNSINGIRRGGRRRSMVGLYEVWADDESFQGFDVKAKSSSRPLRPSLASAEDMDDDVIMRTGISVGIGGGDITESPFQSSGSSLKSDVTNQSTQQLSSLPSKKSPNTYRRFTQVEGSVPTSDPLFTTSLPSTSTPSRASVYDSDDGGDPYAVIPKAKDSASLIAKQITSSSLSQAPPPVTFSSRRDTLFMSKSNESSSSSSPSSSLSSSSLPSSLTPSLGGAPAPLGPVVAPLSTLTPASSFTSTYVSISGLSSTQTTSHNRPEEGDDGEDEDEALRDLHIYQGDPCIRNMSPGWGKCLCEFCEDSFFVLIDASLSFVYFIVGLLICLRRFLFPCYSSTFGPPIVPPSSRPNESSYVMPFMLTIRKFGWPCFRSKHLTVPFAPLLADEPEAYNLAFGTIASSIQEYKHERAEKLSKLDKAIQKGDLPERKESAVSSSGAQVNQTSIVTVLKAIWSYHFKANDQEMRKRLAAEALHQERIKKQERRAQEERTIRIKAAREGLNAENVLEVYRRVRGWDDSEGIETIPGGAADVIKGSDANLKQKALRCVKGVRPCCGACIQFSYLLVKFILSAIIGAACYPLCKCICGVCGRKNPFEKAAIDDKDDDEVEADDDLGPHSHQPKTQEVSVSASGTRTSPRDPVEQKESSVQGDVWVLRDKPQAILGSEKARRVDNRSREERRKNPVVGYVVVDGVVDVGHADHLIHVGKAANQSNDTPITQGRRSRSNSPSSESRSTLSSVSYSRVSTVRDAPMSKLIYEPSATLRLEESESSEHDDDSIPLALPAPKIVLSLTRNVQDDNEKAADPNKNSTSSLSHYKPPEVTSSAVRGDDTTTVGSSHTDTKTPLLGGQTVKLSALNKEEQEKLIENLLSTAGEEEVVDDDDEDDKVDIGEVSKKVYIGSVGYVEKDQPYVAIITFLYQQHASEMVYAYNNAFTRYLRRLFCGCCGGRTGPGSTNVGHNVLQPDPVYGKYLDVRRAKEPEDYLYDSFATSETEKFLRRTFTRVVMAGMLVLNYLFLTTIEKYKVSGGLPFIISTIVGVMSALFNQVLRGFLVVLVNLEKHNSQSAASVAMCLSKLVVDVMHALLTVIAVFDWPDPWCIDQDAGGYLFGSSAFDPRLPGYQGQPQPPLLAPSPPPSPNNLNAHINTVFDPVRYAAASTLLRPVNVTQEVASFASSLSTSSLASSFTQLVLTYAASQAVTNLTSSHSHPVAPPLAQLPPLTPSLLTPPMPITSRFSSTPHVSASPVPPSLPASQPHRLRKWFRTPTLSEFASITASNIRNFDFSSSTYRVEVTNRKEIDLLNRALADTSSSSSSSSSASSSSSSASSSNSRTETTTHINHQTGSTTTLFPYDPSTFPSPMARKPNTILSVMPYYEPRMMYIRPTPQIFRRIADNANESNVESTLLPGRCVDIDRSKASWYTTGADVVTGFVLANFLVSCTMMWLRPPDRFKSWLFRAYSTSQASLNVGYEPPVVELYTQTATLLVSLVVPMVYVSLVPIVIFFALAKVTFVFWIEKHHFANVYRRPAKWDGRLASTTVNVIRWTIAANLLMSFIAFRHTTTIFSGIYNVLKTQQFNHLELVLSRPQAYIVIGLLIIFFFFLMIYLLRYAVLHILVFVFQIVSIPFRVLLRCWRDYRAPKDEAIQSAWLRVSSLISWTRGLLHQNGGVNKVGSKYNFGSYDPTLPGPFFMTGTPSYLQAMADHYCTMIKLPPVEAVHPTVYAYVPADMITDENASTSSTATSGSSNMGKEGRKEAMETKEGKGEKGRRDIVGDVTLEQKTSPLDSTGLSARHRIKRPHQFIARPERVVFPNMSTFFRPPPIQQSERLVLSSSDYAPKVANPLNSSASRNTLLSSSTTPSSPSSSSSNGSVPTLDPTLLFPTVCDVTPPPIYYRRVLCSGVAGGFSCNTLLVDSKTGAVTGMVELNYEQPITDAKAPNAQISNNTPTSTPPTPTTKTTTAEATSPNSSPVSTSPQSLLSHWGPGHLGLSQPFEHPILVWDRGPRRVPLVRYVDNRKYYLDVPESAYSPPSLPSTIVSTPLSQPSTPSSPYFSTTRALSSRNIIVTTPRISSSSTSSNSVPLPPPIKVSARGIVFWHWDYTASHTYTPYVRINNTSAFVPLPVLLPPSPKHPSSSSSVTPSLPPPSKTPATTHSSPNPTSSLSPHNKTASSTTVSVTSTNSDPGEAKALQKAAAQRRLLVVNGKIVDNEYNKSLLSTKSHPPGKPGQQTPSSSSSPSFSLSPSSPTAPTHPLISSTDPRVPTTGLFVPPTAGTVHLTEAGLLSLCAQSTTGDVGQDDSGEDDDESYDSQSTSGWQHFTIKLRRFWRRNVLGCFRGCGRALGCSSDQEHDPDAHFELRTDSSADTTATTLPSSILSTPSHSLDQSVNTRVTGVDMSLNGSTSTQSENGRNSQIMAHPFPSRPAAARTDLDRSLVSSDGDLVMGGRSQERAPKRRVQLYSVGLNEKLVRAASSEWAKQHLPYAGKPAPVYKF